MESIWTDISLKKILSGQQWPEKNAESHQLLLSANLKTTQVTNSIHTNVTIVIV